MVGRLACEWVLKDGSALGGWVGNESGWVCGMRWADGWWRLWIDFDGFYFILLLLFFKVVLMDVSLCWWWLSALLQPWLWLFFFVVVDDDDDGEVV